MLSPVAFQEQLLSRRLWDKQRQICAAIETKRSVAVKGCHGSGKTFTVAGIVPYELLAHDESIVLTIAPTLRQVKLMWNEIESAIRAVPARMPERTTTGWQFSDKRYAQGFSSSKGVNAQGFHGKRVLILADEAIGISGELWDAIEGIRLAGDVRIVKLCNPTVPSGPVYDDFGRNRAVPGHECISISAFDTPNLAGTTMEQLLGMSEEELDYAPYSWLTRRRAVVELYRKWGPNSPRFQSRVLGEFPTQATDAVFQLAWIEKAGLPYYDPKTERPEQTEELKPLLRPGLYIQVGIDVAGPGDDETTACARIGQFVIAQGAWSKANAINEVCAWLHALRTRFPGAAVIVLGDTVGIGFHFMTQVAAQGFDVRAFVAGGAPLNPFMFVNAKAEAYWCSREWMRDGFIRGVTDEDTQAQLSDIRYRETVGGKIEIEHKDQARARGSNSPDRAEAMIMSFVRIVPRERTIYSSAPVEISQY